MLRPVLPSRTPFSGFGGRAALTASTVALIAATAAAPVIYGHAGRWSTGALGAVLAVPTIAAVAFAVLRLGSRVRGAARAGLRFTLHLSPVVLLTLIFPLATTRIAYREVGGAPLTVLLLASSLTVPWLSQAACMPLYRAIGTHVANRDVPAMRRRFCQAWPGAFVKSLPVIVAFAVPVEAFLRFSVSALCCYLVLCVLHMAFAQALIPCNVERRRGVWALAWTAYAAALFAAPQLWLLPPLAGLLTQAVFLRGDLRAALRPDWLETADVAADLVRGTLLGAVLWSDKFLLFLVTRSSFAVSTVFLAMLPAVLAYNYYFVRLAPHFDDSVVRLRRALEAESYGALRERSRGLAGTVMDSIRRTAFVGALIACLTTYWLAKTVPGTVGLFASVGVASWAFALTTIACYKIDYAGARRLAQGFSACHLALCLVLFAVVPIGPGLYFGLAVGESVLLLAVLASCVRHWRTSEYTLFWRHATAW